MKTKHGILYKIFNSLLAVSFCFSSIPSLSAQTAEVGRLVLKSSDLMPLNISMAESLYFPSTVAKVREIFIPEKKDARQFVYLVQDAHCNPKAQENIKAIVQNIMDHTETRFVALEGARGYLDPSVLQTGTVEKRRAVCEEYVEKGVLTGTEALAMCEGESYPDLDLFGLEESPLYLDNFLALQNTFSEKKEVERFVADWKNLIGILKERIFTRKELVDLDRQYEQFSEGRLNRPDYIVYLNQLLEHTQANPEHSGFLQKNEFPNFRQTLESVRLEKSINFEELKQEQQDLVQIIKTKANEKIRLSFEEQEKVFASGMLSPVRFYQEMLDIGKGLNPSAVFENLSKYAEVLNKFKKVRTEKLLGEIQELTLRLKLLFCENDEERKAVRLDYTGMILERMTDLRLTREQLLYYKNNPEEFEPGRIFQWPKEMFEEWGLKWAKTLDLDYFSLPYALHASEEYYHGLIRRDFILTENLLKEMQSRSLNQALMIAGGFHTEGMTDLLREKNIAYMVISPIVGKPTDLYYQIMMGKTLNSELSTNGLAPVLLLDTELGFSSVSVLREILSKLTGKEEISESLLHSVGELQYERMNLQEKKKLSSELDSLLVKGDLPEQVKGLLSDIKKRLVLKNDSVTEDQSGTLRPTGKYNSPSYTKQMEVLKKQEEDFYKQTDSGNKTQIEAAFGEDIQILAYHFNKDGKDIVVFNSNKDFIKSFGKNYEKIKEEALFHEQNEIEWTAKLKTKSEKFGLDDKKIQRMAHILASAEQARKFLGKNKITPFHEYDLSQKKSYELYSLISEYNHDGRREQEEMLQLAIGEFKTTLSIKDIQAYEKSFIEMAKNFYKGSLDKTKLDKAYQRARDLKRTTKLYDAKAGNVKHQSSQSAMDVQRLDEYDRAAQLYHMLKKHCELVAPIVYSQYPVINAPMEPMEILVNETDVFMAASGLLRGPNVHKVEALFNILAQNENFYSLSEFIQRFFSSTHEFGGGRAGYLNSILKTGEPSSEHRLALRLGLYHSASASMRDVYAYAKTLKAEELMEYLADPVVHKKMNKYIYRRLVALAEKKIGILLDKDNISLKEFWKLYPVFKNHKGSTRVFICNDKHKSYNKDFHVPGFLWKELGVQYKDKAKSYNSLSDKYCTQIFKQYFHFVRVKKDYGFHWNAFRKEIMDWANQAGKEEIAEILKEDSQFLDVLKRQYVDHTPSLHLKKTREQNLDFLKRDLAILKDDLQTDRSVSQIEVYLDEQAQKYWVTRKKNDKATTDHISKILRMDQKVEPSQALIEWYLKSRVMSEKPEDRETALNALGITKEDVSLSREAYKRSLVIKYSKDEETASDEAEKVEIEKLLSYLGQTVTGNKQLFDNAFALLRGKMEKATMNESQIESVRLQFQYGKSAGELYIRLFRLANPVRKIKKLGIQGVYNFEEKLLKVLKQMNPEDSEFELLRNDKNLLDIIQTKVNPNVWASIRKMLGLPLSLEESPYEGKILNFKDVEKLAESAKKNNIGKSSDYWGARLFNAASRREMYSVAYMARQSATEKYKTDKEINAFMKRVLDKSGIMDFPSLWLYDPNTFQRLGLLPEYDELISFLKGKTKISSDRMVKLMGGKFFGIHLKRKTHKDELSDLIQSTPSKDLLQHWSNFGELKVLTHEKSKIQSQRLECEKTIEELKKSMEILKKGKRELHEAEKELKLIKKSLREKEEEILKFNLDIHPDILKAMGNELKRSDRIEMLITLRNRLADELESNEDLQKYVFEETEGHVSPSFFLYAGESLRATGLIEKERLLQSGVQWRAFSNKAFIRSECCHDVLGKVREMESLLSSLSYASKEEQEKQIKMMMETLPDLLKSLDKEQEEFKAVREKYNARVKLIISTIITIITTAICIGFGVPALPAWIQFSFALAQVFVSKSLEFIADWALNGDSFQKMNMPFEMISALIVGSVSTLIGGGINWWVDFQAMGLYSLPAENPAEIAKRIFGIAAMGVVKSQINSVVSDPLAYFLEEYFATSKSGDHFFSDTAQAFQKKVMGLPKDILCSFLRGVAFQAVKQQGFMSEIRYRSIFPTEKDLARIREGGAVDDWTLSNPLGLFKAGQYMWSPAEDQIGWGAAAKNALEDVEKEVISKVPKLLNRQGGKTERSVSERKKDDEVATLLDAFDQEGKKLAEQLKKTSDDRKKLCLPLLKNELSVYANDRENDKRLRHILKNFVEEMDKEDFDFDQAFIKMKKKDKKKSPKSVDDIFHAIVEKINQEEAILRLDSELKNFEGDFNELRINRMLLEDTSVNSRESLSVLVQSFLSVERGDSALKERLNEACKNYLKGKNVSLSSLGIKPMEALPMEFLKSAEKRKLNIPGDGDCLFTSMVVSSLKGFLKEEDAEKFKQNIKKLAGEMNDTEIGEIKRLIGEFINDPSNDQPLREVAMKKLIKKIRTHTVDSYEDVVAGVTKSEARDRKLKVREFKNLMKKAYDQNAEDQKDEAEKSYLSAKYFKKKSEQELTPLKETFEKNKQKARVLWGGQIDIRVMSVNLKRPVFVYTKNREGTSYSLLDSYGEEYLTGDNDPVFLVYSSGNHYEVFNPGVESESVRELHKPSDVSGLNESLIDKILFFNQKIREKKSSDEDQVVVTLFSDFLDRYLETKNLESSLNEIIKGSRALSSHLKRFQEKIQEFQKSEEKKGKSEEESEKKLEEKKGKSEEKIPEGGYIGAGNNGMGKLVQKEGKTLLEVTEENQAPKQTPVLDTFDENGIPKGLSEKDQKAFVVCRQKALTHLDNPEVRAFLKAHHIQEEQMDGVIAQAKQNLIKLFSFGSLKNSEQKYVLSCGIEGRIGFDEGFFRGLLEKPELLGIVLFHEALESVTPTGVHDDLRALQKNLFSENDVNLTHFIRAFNLTRQLQDSVKNASFTPKEMEAKLIEYFKTSREAGMGFLLQNILQGHLDIALVDQILAAAGKADLDATPSLISFLYKELSTTQDDRMIRVKALLANLGLADYEIKNISKALEKVSSKVILEENKLQGLNEVDEILLGMIGARLLDAQYTSKESRKKAAEKVAECLISLIPRKGNSISQGVSSISRSLMDTEQDVTAKLKDSSIDEETRNLLKSLFEQQKILQKYAEFKESAAEGDGFELNAKVTFVKQKNGIVAVMKTEREGSRTFSETELIQKTGMSMNSWMGLKGAMYSDLVTANTGTGIRTEISNTLLKEDLKKGDRKSLFVVSKDMSDPEIREVVAFLKKVAQGDAVSNHRITGDTEEFIHRAMDMGLLDKNLTEDLLRQQLCLGKNDLNKFQNDKPLMIIGRQGLEAFQNNPKTLLVNSTKSIQGSMVGLFAFLNKDRTMIDQLQSTFKDKNDQLELLAKSLETISSATKAIEIQFPELKPLMDSILSQLADEEETVMIAG